MTSARILTCRRQSMKTASTVTYPILVKATVASNPVRYGARTSPAEGSGTVVKSPGAMSGRMDANPLADPAERACKEDDT